MNNPWEVKECKRKEKFELVCWIPYKSLITVPMSLDWGIWTKAEELQMGKRGGEGHHDKSWKAVTDKCLTKRGR